MLRRHLLSRRRLLRCQPQLVSAPPCAALHGWSHCLQNRRGRKTQKKKKKKTAPLSSFPKIRSRGIYTSLQTSRVCVKQRSLTLGALLPWLELAEAKGKSKSVRQVKRRCDPSASVSLRKRDNRAFGSEDRARAVGMIQRLAKGEGILPW